MINELIITFFAVLGGITVILFFLRVLLKKNVEEIKFDPAKYNSIVKDQVSKGMIDELLSKNSKIEAINYLKTNKKLSLMEAKNMIEKYAENKTPGVMNVYNKMTSAIGDDNDLITRIKTLISQGKKIEAIKLVVQSRGIGLKEAKNFVDTLG